MLQWRDEPIVSQVLCSGLRNMVCPVPLFQEYEHCSIFKTLRLEQEFVQ
jgi:hypothetical protein